VIKHPEPKDRHTRFDKLHVRLYGDVGIVNGSVIASRSSSRKCQVLRFLMSEARQV